MTTATKEAPRASGPTIPLFQLMKSPMQRLLRTLALPTTARLDTGTALRTPKRCSRPRPLVLAALLLIPGLAGIAAGGESLAQTRPQNAQPPRTWTIRDAPPQDRPEPRSPTTGMSAEQLRDFHYRRRMERLRAQLRVTCEQLPPGNLQCAGLLKR